MLCCVKIVPFTLKNSPGDMQKYPPDIEKFPRDVRNLSSNIYSPFLPRTFSEGDKCWLKGSYLNHHH